VLHCLPRPRGGVRRSGEPQRVVTDLDSKRVEVGGVEGWHAEEELIEHNAQRPNVDGAGVGSTTKQFRRKIKWSAAE
jgi:hypothetical protein